MIFNVEWSEVMWCDVLLLLLLLWHLYSGEDEGGGYITLPVGMLSNSNDDDDDTIEGRMLLSLSLPLQDSREPKEYSWKISANFRTSKWTQYFLTDYFGRSCEWASTFRTNYYGIDDDPTGKTFHGELIWFDSNSGGTIVVCVTPLKISSSSPSYWCTLLLLLLL